jgi:hypothetical protein
MDVSPNRGPLAFRYVPPKCRSWNAGSRFGRNGSARARRIRNLARANEARAAAERAAGREGCVTVAEFQSQHERRVAALTEKFGAMRYTNCEPRFTGGRPVERKKVYTSSGLVFMNTDVAARWAGMRRTATIREAIRIQSRSRKDGCRFAYQPFEGVSYGKERAA